MSPVPVPGVLGEIVEHTRRRVEVGKRTTTIEWLLTRTGPARRAFGGALAEPGINVIAEHKRRSPSRGAIREDLAPADVAESYSAGGAAAMSVLTEPEYFGGAAEHLEEARAACPLPLLRKDFIVDAWQVWETRAMGADALLLIVAALGDEELRDLLGTTRDAGLEALVEVHDAAELRRALDVGARIVGVNNRDLRTLEVSLETGLRLVESIPDDVIAVAESGIRCAADLRRLKGAGFDAFLIGESLMSARDPGAALRALLDEAGSA